MATQTTNLGLIKPAGTDKIRIAQINGNMDILDEKLGAVGNTSLQAQVTANNTAIARLDFNRADTLDSGNCNDLDAGTVYCNAGVTNLPVAAAMFVQTMRMGQHAIQLAYYRSADACYFRRCSSGTWSEWQIIANQTKTFQTESWNALPGNNITKTLSAGTYLVVVDAINSSSSTVTDVYIIGIHSSNSHIVTIKDAGSGNHRATLSVSTTTLTIAPVSTYTRVTITLLNP